VFGGPQASSAEDTNLALDQRKPQCIPPIILGFSFNHYNCAMLDCTLSLSLSTLLVLVRR
jgi:hypothetical protein